MMHLDSRDTLQMLSSQAFWLHAKTTVIPAFPLGFATAGPFFQIVSRARPHFSPQLVHTGT